MRNFRCQLENVQIETVLNIWGFGLKATALAHYPVYFSEPGSERTAAWLSGHLEALLGLGHWSLCVHRDPERPWQWACPQAVWPP